MYIKQDWLKNIVELSRFISNGKASNGIVYMMKLAVVYICIKPFRTYSGLTFFVLDNSAHVDTQQIPSNLEVATYGFRFVVSPSHLIRFPHTSATEVPVKFQSVTLRWTTH